MGGISKAILAAAGSTIQDECKSKYGDGLLPGTIAETGGGNMAVKAIYHIVVPRQNKGADNLEQKAEAELVWMKILIFKTSLWFFWSVYTVIMMK